MSESETPPGKFMVAASAVLEHVPTGNVLMVRRSDAVDFASGVWEDVSGRLHQGEDPEQGLRRELREEVGISEVDVVRPLRVYHFFRGSDSPDREVIGIAYWCRTHSTDVALSNEHDGYRWMSPADAMTIAGTEGIRASIAAFLRERSLLDDQAAH